VPLKNPLCSEQGTMQEATDFNSTIEERAKIMNVVLMIMMDSDALKSKVPQLSRYQKVGHSFR
jgi:hypothetical protein